MPTDPGTKTERDDHAPTELADTRVRDAAPATTAVMAAPAARPPDAAGEARVIGRFRLEAPLGSGGMADVHRAYDPMLDRAVALKVLRTKRAGDDPQRMRRVLREARAAAALTHPNTVTIFDVGEADGEVFIAMELLEGEVLRDVLGRPDIPVERKLRWLLQAARALAAAHERGLVHRDVKPDNMFVCKDGTLKLLDFGIAKRDDDDTLDPSGEVEGLGPSSLRTTEGRRLGTPRYMAPEQHAGTSTDARTDEYAWGLVAFELLTGAHPLATLATVTMGYAGEATTLTSARHDDLRAKVPELSEEIVSAIVRALEPHKDDRFPSMAPIVAALEAAQDRRGAREVARAISVAPRAASTASETSAAPRGSHARLAAVVAALAIGAAGIAGGGVAVRKELRAREAARIALLPACRVDSRATFAIGPDDRPAVLPDGTVFIARNAKRGVVLERQPAPGAPFTVVPALAALGSDYEEVGLTGTTFHEKSSIVVEMSQGPQRGALLTMWTANGEWMMSRVSGPLTGLAFTPFGERLAVVTTTENAESRPDGLPASAELYLLALGGPIHRAIEHGVASAPAVATSGDRIGAAYVTRGELRFALLDKNGERLGDAVTVTKDATPPAVAFVGDAAVVLWVREDHGRRRLVSAMRRPNEAAFATAKVASEDSVLWQPTPLATRVADGSFAVAWVAADGARSAVRVAPLGASGNLAGATDVDSAGTVTRLQAVASNHDIVVSWVDADSSLKVAHVTCGAAR